MYDHIAPDAFNDPSIAESRYQIPDQRGCTRELIASEFHGEIKETCILRIRNILLFFFKI